MIISNDTQIIIGEITVDKAILGATIIWENKIPKIPNNEIWYTMLDNTLIDYDSSWPDTDVFGATVTSHTNNNGKGVSGVAGGSGKGDGCRIMSCQIFSGNYGGGVAQTVNAIKYAADMGASIISCSFGYQASFSSDNQYIARVGSAEIDAIHYFEACDNNDVLDGNVAMR